MRALLDQRWVGSQTPKKIKIIILLQVDEAIVDDCLRCASRLHLQVEVDSWMQETMARSFNHDEFDLYRFGRGPTWF